MREVEQMNFSEFSHSTLLAFERIEKEYFSSHVIKKDYILFKRNEFYLEVYFENYFEVNVNFSFCENGEYVNVSLKNIMTYLNFEKKELNQVTKNQFSSEKGYSVWILEIAKICESVLEVILRDKSLLISCYHWQKDMNNLFLYNVNMDFVKKNLNDFWKNKNYSAYLSYYLNNCQEFVGDSAFSIFEKRAKYIQNQETSENQWDGIVCD